MKHLLERIRQSSFFVKITNWEFYPMFLANLPVVFIWLFFSIKARHLFFFSRVNPVIETGGVLGESKINILRRLPEKTLPKTIFIEKKVKRSSASSEYLLEQIQEKEINFPLIAKPNVGERGFMVVKINSIEQLVAYHLKVSFDYLIQEFIDLPLEISVLYHRMPQGGQGKVTSVCIKKTLSVIGDGVSTIEELMYKYPRARFQLDRFRKDFPTLLTIVLDVGVEQELEPIGNHSRGTTFLNGNEHIDASLHSVFDDIGQQMDGVYYGRFDMKCKSIETLKKGEHIKIMEFNGIASEPAHIYDHTYEVSKAYSDIYQHWKIIYKISKQQKNKGVQAMSFKEAYESIVAYVSHLRSVKANS